ncbi:MAG TPA: response regulator, partial [Candidatus Nitrosotalea sp.]|nr:response regulator [Candidatus Nitrosotalea sp.]
RGQLPDLVITDVNMPNVGGLELTKRLRSHHRTARIPIIMLSALKQPSDILAGYAEGADEYIPKPIELSVLAAKVEILIRRYASAGAETPSGGKVVLFMHGKGGVGTTSLLINCAAALARESSVRTSILDLNLEFGNAAMHLNLLPARSIADLAQLGSVEVDQEIFADFVARDAHGVSVVIGCDRPEKSELVTLPAIQLALDRLREISDVILVDAPASFSERNLIALDAADLVILVTSGALPSLKSTLDLMEVLVKIKVRPERIRMVLNQSTSRGATQAQASEFFDRPPELVIPHSELFDDAANTGLPVLDGRPGPELAAALESLAQLVRDGVYDGP